MDEFVGLGARNSGLDHIVDYDIFTSFKIAK